MVETILSFLTELTGDGSPFNMVDIAIIVYLLYGLIRGLFRGFAAEFAGLFGSILVFIIAWRGYRPASDFVMANTRLDDEVLAQLTGYIILVCLFMILWNLAVFILKEAVNLTFGKRLERLGGLLLGCGKSAMICCLILTAVGLSNHQFLRQHFIEESWFGQATQRRVPEKLHEILPDIFEQPEQDEEDSDTAETSET